MAAVNLLARGYRFEVSSDNTTWVRPKGLSDLNPSFSPNLEDANDYDSNGFSAKEVTLIDWSVSVSYNRKSDTGVEDPGQALMRACMAQFGDNARLYVRWYRTDGIAEAWSGRAIVDIENANTATTNIASWKVTFTGDGPVTQIANPYAANAAPVVTSATPSGVAAGGLVTVKGTGFTGTVATTGVKIGGVNATSWNIVSDTALVAVMPAGSAGSAPIIVTNATGASASFAYTRG